MTATTNMVAASPLRVSECLFSSMTRGAAFRQTRCTLYHCSEDTWLASRLDERRSDSGRREGKRSP